MDEDRIYAAGKSDGANFTYVLLAKRPEVFAAFAAVAGDGEPFLQWATVPKPVMLVNGSEDQFYPTPLFLRQLRHVLDLNGCPDQPQPWTGTSTPYYSQYYQEYGPCASGQPVIWRLHRGEHVWPGPDAMHTVRFFQSQANLYSSRREDAHPVDDRAAGHGGDGGPARSAQLMHPYGLTSDRTGNVFIVDAANAGGTFDSRVRRVDSRGTITTLAGGRDNSLAPRPPKDGASALDASLYLLTDAVADGKGSVYVADPFGARIFRVNPDGTVTNIAGTGSLPIGGNLTVGKSWGFAGDDGPAGRAKLLFPSSLALSPDGTLYVADAGNHRIRAVTPDGIIQTLAGRSPAVEIGGYKGGQQLSFPDRIPRDSGPTYSYAPDVRQGGYGGDGFFAAYALLNDPHGLALAPDGSLYVSDTRNHRIRKITTGGIIKTVAGTGEAGYSGDGGPATQARLNFPMGLSLGDDGSLYIADMKNHRVRKLSPDGILTTVAGGGDAAEGQPATRSRLYFPTDAEMSAWGDLFIADPYNHRVLKVSPEGILTTFAGGGMGDDVNGDGVTNIADVQAILADAVHLRLVTPEVALRADIDGDGSVTVRDAVLLLRRVIGL